MTKREKMLEWMRKSVEANGAPSGLSDEEVVERYATMRYEEQPEHPVEICIPENFENFNDFQKTITNLLYSCEKIQNNCYDRRVKIILNGNPDYTILT